MNSVRVYNWPAGSTTNIAQLQTLAAAGYLNLNGSLTTLNNNNYYVNFGTILRTVGLTSTNNLSGVNFIVYGTLNGSTVSQTIAGPNNNTVYTTQFFDTVTNIYASAAAVAVSAGAGTTGQTKWFLCDVYRPYFGVSVQTEINGTANDLQYRLETTLDDVATISVPLIFSGVTLPQPGNAQAFYTVMGDNSTDGDFAYLNYPVLYLNVSVTSSALVDNTGSLKVTIVQQGIR